jgi:Protein of unknown function (DUF2934)
MKSRMKAPIATGESAARSSRILNPRSTGPTEEQIRLRAYEIYVERGRVDGQDQEDWIQAEKELTEIIHQRQSA